MRSANMRSANTPSVGFSPPARGGGRRTVSIGLACRLDIEHSLARGLRSLWKSLPDSRGVSWYDLGPNGVRGMLNGMTPSDSWIATPRGIALGFDGTDDYVTMGVAPPLDLRTGNATLMAWAQFSQVQPDMDGTDHVSAICGKGCLGNSVGHGLIVRNDTIRYQVRYGASAQLEAVSDTTLCDGKWHHVCGTLDRSSATGVRLYVDGILQSATADATPSSGIDLANSLPFAIGARYDTSWDYHFLGRLDDIRFCASCLSAAEVRSAYHDSAMAHYAMLRRPRSRRLATIEPSPLPPPIAGTIPWHLLLQRAV